MAWMAGSIGSILPVGLLGRTRICQTTPVYGTVQLNRTYQDNQLGSWTDGNAVTHEHQVGRDTPNGCGQRNENLRNELRGTEVLEAIMASVIALAAVILLLGGVVIVVLGVVAREVRREDRLYSLAQEAPSMMSRRARRLNGFGRRDLYITDISAARRVVA
jgi:hypothetical protein